MAIQTRGFTGVQSPTITVADPRLVAFQPDQLARGIGQAFQLAGQYEQVKAAQAERQEKALLAERRIAAAKAKFDAETEQAVQSLATFKPRADAQIAEANQVINTTPGIIEATNAGNRARTLDAGINIDTAPSRREIAMTQAEAGAARVAQEEDLKNAALDLNQANTLSSLRLQPAQAALAELQLGDQSANFTSDAALKRETARAQLNNINSEAEARRVTAQARLLEAQKEGSGAAVLDKEIGNVETRLARLYSTKIDGLAAADYIKQFYDPETNKPKTGWFGDAKTRPAQEAIVKQINELEKVKATLMQGKYPSIGEATQALQAPVPPAQAAAPSAQPSAQPARMRLRFGPDRKLIDSTGK